MWRRWIFGIMLVGLSTTAMARAQTPQWAIVIHGGALGRTDGLSDARRAAMERSLAQALDRGTQILADGGSSLDAVEAVIRLLEDDPLFNAGRGAVLNSEGRHELDASIMDGRDLKCGAVAGVRTVQHPITLARRVMEKTRHVLLAGDGAEQFADEMKVERRDETYFRTEERRKEWEKIRAAEQRKESTGQASEPRDVDHLGTVGCAALDMHGNLAAGTSTGGLVNKKYGRVGDSPIIGAGTYADNATCAVSCTGVGEEFIRRAVAYDVSAQMRYRGATLEDAVKTQLRERLPAGTGGIIAVSSRGEVIAMTNTAGLSRAMADARGRREVTVGK